MRLVHGGAGSHVQDCPATFVLLEIDASQMLLDSLLQNWCIFLRYFYANKLKYKQSQYFKVQVNYILGNWLDFEYTHYFYGTYYKLWVLPVDVPKSRNAAIQIPNI